MHGISAHSAMAIKRQRRRRANDRRGKGKTRQSVEAARQASMSNKVMGTITMFHVGAVFLTVGCFLMLAAVITNETNRAEMAELIGTGVVCLVIGLFLVILNRFYGQKEEEELQNYVETRLARTRSGQRLYHESDSYPDNLDDNCSRSPSMDSGVSNDYASSSKSSKQKKNKKAAKGESLFQAPHPPATVSVINEHNHRPSDHDRRNNSSGGIEEISPGGVTLERISEEASEMARHNSSHSQHHQHHHHHSEDPSGYSRGGSNLYRVYDATNA